MDQDNLANRPIFVLDNSPALLALYKAGLEYIGEKVHTFRSGEEALLQIDGHHPKLFIVGAELEDAHCQALIPRLRDVEKCANTPIIVISSSRSSDFRQQCFKLGIADFIPRAASQDVFIEHVQAVLHRKALFHSQAFKNRQKMKVLVAEDSLPLRHLYRELLLEMGVQPRLCKDGQEAWEYLCHHPDRVDIVLTDLEMPQLSGEALLSNIRGDDRFKTLPVIVITRYDAQEKTVGLLRAGATDYINKPFITEELQARIAVHLYNGQLIKEQLLLSDELRVINDSLEQKVKERTQQLDDANKEMMLKLALVCDLKDESTGNHINRVRLYCQELGRASGMPEGDIEHFGYSSMLHDVGKVAIPDSILKKAGPLDEEEWTVMRTHAARGAELLGDREFFRVAREIAQYHHERMDGQGYPLGLSGEEIPLTARIAAVVDVFDALTSKRCYKEAWAIDDAFAELHKMAEDHLDPVLVDKLEQLHKQGVLDYIRESYP